jgi:hypothetical protein
LLEGDLNLEKNRTPINIYIFKSAEHITEVFPENLNYWLKAIASYHKNAVNAAVASTHPYGFDPKVVELLGGYLSTSILEM